MKIAVTGFFLLLVFRHSLGDTRHLLEFPLSEFRDGQHAWLGYSLFAILLLAGFIYTRAMALAERAGEAAAAALATFLLLIVAATPSWGQFHLVCSVIVLGLLFAYFAILLYRAGSLWLFAHFAVPLALALATRFQSYGVWQKALIVYFVLALVIRHHLLVTQIRMGGEPRRPLRRITSTKRRKVYRLDPGPTWSRRISRTDGSTNPRCR
jgi:hypothetical protein